MASRWGSEFNVSEHRDLQANAMALDRDGNNILLAGKRHIALKNLNDASDSLKKFPRHSKYEIGTAEWNPTSLYSQYCALSANQKIDIFAWYDGQLQFMYSLKYHTRLVTDLNWHRFEPYLVASCSIDTYTHVWDIRDPRKPSITFSAIASSNHVQWNKLTTYFLATAHDGDIRIWDLRKGTAPVQYISAHLSKIHDLDWSQTHEYQLASCSQDGTVKFFDVMNPKCTESVIQTAAPVWRARYTPFGEGLVTVVIPQTRRTENSLLLWNLSNQSIPVYTFVGHTDIVLEFEWRKQRLDASEYQLITWSKDQSLRTWRIEPFLQKLCGYDLDADAQQLGEDITSDIVHINANDLPASDIRGLFPEDIIPAVEAMNVDSFSDIDLYPCSERNIYSIHDAFKCLELEFSSLSAISNTMNIKIDEINILKRSCMITAWVKSLTVSLQVTFPMSYPCNAAPSFQIEDSSTIDSMLKTKLLKVLKLTAQQRVKKNKMCLESCVTQLLSTMENSAPSSESENMQFSRLSSTNSTDIALNPNSYLYGTVHDVHIPYPKTCGARFCSVDILVCFHRSVWPRKVVDKTDAITPRSLSNKSELKHFTYPMMYVSRGGVRDAQNRSIPYYIQNQNQNPLPLSENLQNSLKSQSLFSKTVSLFDCSKLFFTHRELGEKYVFDTNNTEEMCRKNAEIAASLGRQDLIQTWTLASLIATPTGDGTELGDNTLWPNHPFSRSQIDYLILHYAKMFDVQTAAMLCCAFTSKTDLKGSYTNRFLNTKSVSATPGGSPYHTIHPIEANVENSNLNSTKQNRSNSWSESLDELKSVGNILDYKEVSDLDSYEKNFKVLDDKNCIMYDELKRKYADILHRWNLLEKRVQVTKLLSVATDCYKVMEFSSECSSCKKRISGSAYCSSCKIVILRCALCRILVRGSSNFCLICGHGGHAKHMLEWFKTELICPTGCGCKCLLETSNMFEI